ncbi:MAG: hypothetical protein RJA99_2889 [Pseudomonadota bacterium]|jgi:IS5 family transposase
MQYGIGWTGRHEPGGDRSSGVPCIETGKARTPYEFGSKAGIATTPRGSLIVGRAPPTANRTTRTRWPSKSSRSSKATIQMRGTGAKPRTAWVDLGWHGVEDENPEIEIKHRCEKTRVSEREVGTLKRRQAIEPVIEHLTSDPRWGAAG